MKKLIHDLLVLLNIRGVFPEEIGIGTLALCVFIILLISGVIYFAVFKLHEILFYKEERTELEEVSGWIKFKKIENRKNIFKRGKIEEVKILIVGTRRMGEILIEDEVFFNKFDKRDLVKVIFQKKYLVRRFKKDAKYLGLHIVEIIKRRV